MDSLAWTVVRKEPVDVLFIAGTPRCGSTAVEATLASRPGVVAVGELQYLWERGLLANMLCSCGAPFRSCPFWAAVLADAFGGFEEVDAHRMVALCHSVCRIRYLPMLRWPSLRSPGYRRRLDECAAIVGSVFDSVAAVSGATTVVDSSKYATYGFLLSAVPSLRVQAIHLVRDSRAVGNSWRQAKRRPEVHWEEHDMDRLSGPAVVWLWTWTNVVGDLLRRHLQGSQRVRYEDWSDSVERQERLFDILDGTRPRDRPGAMHSVSGNPVRFDPAAMTRIRLDERWRHELPTWPYLGLTAATAPLLLAFRYRLRRHSHRTAGRTGRGRRPFPPKEPSAQEST